MEDSGSNSRLFGGLRARGGGCFEGKRWGGGGLDFEEGGRE